MPKDSNSKPYTCSICHRHFGSRSALKTHMWQHEGPDKCKTCGEVKRGPYHRCGPKF